MRKSKLEMYEEMLRALVDRPSTVDNLAYQCKMDCVALRQRLDFLMKSGLVEEKNYRRRTAYALTRRGIAIFQTLNIARRLEKLQTTITVIDNATAKVLGTVSVTLETRR